MPGALTRSAVALALSLWMAALQPPSGGGTAGAAEPPDPIAEQIARWTAVIEQEKRSDDLWRQVKASALPELERAGQALRDGRRWFALERLAAVWPNVDGAFRAGGHPAEARSSLAALEREWTRAKPEFDTAAGAAATESLKALQPWVVRALAEIALSQARALYGASLEYGRNTTPEFGFFYLESARAQLEFVELCRSLAPAAGATAGSAPRDMAAEIDDLETELLAAYRPPASIGRHAEFIAASGALKEARELSGAGLRHGALLRYLQASMRVALIAPPAAAGSEGPLPDRIRRAAEGLTALGDASLGRLFAERAEVDAGRSDDPAARSSARAVASVVLPRLVAALGPAAARPAKAEPQATITLVRWPFT